VTQQLDQQTRRLEGAPELPRAEVRALSRTRDLADLFGRRPDLAGVYSPADLTAEAVRWSA
jgi:hypothetical protein